MKRGTLIGLTSAAAAVAVIIAVMVTLVIIQPKPGPAALTSVTYSTYRSVQGWDDSVRTETAPERMRELADALDRSGWVRGQVVPLPDCDGGLDINLELTYADGSTTTLHAGTCGSGSWPVGDAVAAVLENW